MSESSSTSSFPTAQALAKASSARRYNAAFKQDAVNLIAQEGYSFAAAAQQRWRKLNASEHIPDVIAGVRFTDGIKQAA